jgi:hypothetical protein
MIATMTKPRNDISHYGKRKTEDDGDRSPAHVADRKTDNHDAN